MLGDLKYKSVVNIFDLKGIKDRWEVALKLDIDDGTDNL